MKPRISIALCTYNGESFLRQQLGSIAKQTLLPDEVIISDDGSADSTPDIVKKFGDEVPFRVEWLSNSKNLGTTKNFEQAIRACKGEYIFLCDQDDYWLPDKIQQLATYLDEQPEVHVVFTDALLVDDNLNSLDKSLFKELRFLPEQKRRWREGNALDVLIQGNRVTGCTVAARREFIERILPFPEDYSSMNFIHDTWIAWTAALENKIQFLDQQTVLYRQHDKQQIGAERKNSPKRLRFIDRFSRTQEQKLNHYKIQEIYFSKILTMLSRYPLSDRGGLKKIERARKHFQIRGSLPSNRLARIKPVVANFMEGNYHHFLDAEARWYAPYLAIIGDIVE